MKLDNYMDGHTFENSTILPGGGSVSFNPGINGILINYIPHTDHEGNHYLRPCVSILCVDMELSKKLSETARAIIRSTIPTIQTEEPGE